MNVYDHARGRSTQKSREYSAEFIHIHFLQFFGWNERMSNEQNNKYIVLKKILFGKLPDMTRWAMCWTDDAMNVISCDAS